MYKKILILCIFILFGLMVNLVFGTPGDIVVSFPAPGQCSTGLTFDGKALWLSDRFSDSLYAINPETGIVMQTMEAPGYIPLGLAWDGKYLWCIDGEENRIYKLDIKTGIAVKSIEAPSYSPQGMAWDGEALWISDDRADMVMQISTEDGTTILEFPSPSGSPQGLTWDGRYLWCADRAEDRIYMMETTYGEVLLSIDAPGAYARGLAWQDGYMWNADYQDDKLHKLVVDDGVQVKSSDFRREELILTSEFRNYGPGEVIQADIYFALPVDRPNQKLLGDIIFSPEPRDFILDRWGQKFAHFVIEKPPLTKRVRSTITVEVELAEARWFVFPEKVGNLDDIPKEIMKKYLVNEDKYRINDPIIQQAAQAAVGDETNPYWIMRKVYKYVRDNMYYELAGGWNVAPAILERGNGSCSEYSFVFIAVCRAAGLPARYVGSVVTRGDDASTDDVFHRWCECYLPGYGWVPVDPSGGDSDSPARVAEYFGHLSNRFLITTEGGGASEYMEWGYNVNEFYQSKGPVKVHVETVGEWSPMLENPVDDGTQGLEEEGCKVE